GGHRPLVSKLPKNRRRVLLPSGEGGQKGRMRAKMAASSTLTRRSAPPSPGGRGTHPYMTAKLKSTPPKRLSREPRCNFGQEWSQTAPTIHCLLMRLATTAAPKT